MRRAGKCCAVWSGCSVTMLRHPDPGARSGRGSQRRSRTTRTTHARRLVWSIVTAGLAAALGWGLAHASAEPEVEGSPDRHVDPWNASGERGAQPCTGNLELVEGLRSGAAYAAADGDDDDEPSDESHAVADCLLGGGISLTAGSEGPELDHVGHVEHEAVGVFQRCYGGQSTRADPHRAG